MEEAALIIGIIFILYYAMICFYSGVSSSFSLFWLISGSLLCIIGFAMHYVNSISILLEIEMILRTIFFVFIVAFIYIQLKIINTMNKTISQEADYIIILGARVKGRKPSKSLRKRLERAVEYLQYSPKTKVVVSGGKGKDEEISEAQAMFVYLTDHGISKERILLEEHSSTTRENLYNSIKLTGADSSIGIVTNDFHIYRAVMIARKLGYSKVEGVPAKSVLILQPNYMVREFFAIIQDKITGKI